MEKKQDKKADDLFKFELKILSQIIKLGTIITLGVSIIYILNKMPLGEIKSGITYYYSEALVAEGKEDALVDFTSDSGTHIKLPAIDIVSNPLIMLSKQQLNWAMFKGLFIGYISFKIFCILFLGWVYIRRKVVRS